ncbi:G-type lectin S-receptor-like serine/threonine-protein kinase At4g27290 isoform X2 [Rutidosis leptorrhynchoides]|uniref:G-type lectin S-receptor-like serine/threonine-protein kinase At4g27290 isoform X2 n=1 Tax=Rutidosis leptorrhynchoides TaxID=125765 RepID=UPI003A99FC3F
MKKLFTIIIYLYFHELFTCIMAADTLTINQTLKDGETIVSANESFELGFFSPSNNTVNRYLGIWYKRPATGPVIWVANRETPISNKSGELTLSPRGLLELRYSTTNRTIWSSDLTRNTGNVVAQLLDNSNFVILDSQYGHENYIWQSFDYPTDTVMPDMKFGRNLKRGVVTSYTSWKSDEDPSQGKYTVYMDFNGLAQIFHNIGDDIQYRAGSWNGLQYSGSTNNQPNLIYRNWFTYDENEISAVYVLQNKSVLTRVTISPQGNMEQWYWINRTQGWFVYASFLEDSCDRYALCGVYGSCDIEQSPNCGCLRGFTPKRPDHWNIADWTSGCQREIGLDCRVREGFGKYSFMKLPDTRKAWFDRNMTLQKCKVKCTNECNCTAYATLNIKLGSGCVLWYSELIDMRILPDNGQDIFIRMSATESEKDKIGSRRKKIVWAIAIPVALGLVSAVGICILILNKKKTAKVMEADIFHLPLFSFSILLTATDNFSEENKLGEGGFGPVYKGFLEDGQEVAVKRLSRCSNQGVEEFKNEILFISKLQHRNLVKILGYCIQREERLLVYEYMPNKGLDLYIYKDKSKNLDWPQLFNIINGIARGLLYLHQDSQLRIIHRDLKAANILLDREMNPKISDFGTARTFIKDDAKTTTKRLVGTYGYMSPEYAGNGIISVKSDVFSFGVIVLEAVSGMKNRGFCHEAHSQNLLGHAWKLYKEGNVLELFNVSTLKSNQISEVLRSIQVGLLCVQHNPDDRPNMSEVIAMLSGKSRLAEPKQPGFFIEQSCESLATVVTPSTNNDVTFTILEAR